MASARISGKANPREPSGASVGPVTPGAIVPEVRSQANYGLGSQQADSVKFPGTTLVARHSWVWPVLLGDHEGNLMLSS
jgi:hypothetical protein